MTWQKWISLTSMLGSTANSSERRAMTAASINEGRGKVDINVNNSGSIVVRIYIPTWCQCHKMVELILIQQLVLVWWFHRKHRSWSQWEIFIGGGFIFGGYDDCRHSCKDGPYLHIKQSCPTLNAYNDGTDMGSISTLVLWNQFIIRTVVWCSWALIQPLVHMHMADDRADQVPGLALVISI